jgi:hypothetical protein
MKEYEYHLEPLLSLQAQGELWIKENKEEAKLIFGKKKILKPMLLYLGLNKLGKRGWELCGINDGIFYFKKEK